MNCNKGKRQKRERSQGRMQKRTKKVELTNTLQTSHCRGEERRVHQGLQIWARKEELQHEAWARPRGEGVPNIEAEAAHRDSVFKKSSKEAAERGSYYWDSREASCFKAETWAGLWVGEPMKTTHVRHRTVGHHSARETRRRKAHFVKQDLLFLPRRWGGGAKDRWELMTADEGGLWELGKTAFNFATEHEMGSAKELRGVHHWGGGGCDMSIWDGENCQSSHKPLSRVWKCKLIVEFIP